jgi:hypothetical protein
VPAGLFALTAMGVHSAADVVDDLLLSFVDALDARSDAYLASFEVTAGWVDRIGPFHRTLIARSLALAWELAVDVLVVLPQLGYAESVTPHLARERTPPRWRQVVARLNRKPTPARLIRPLVTLLFVLAGGYSVARLVESTLFVALQTDVASTDVAQWLARVLSMGAMALVLGRFGWRAVLRALEHADAACERVERTGRKAWQCGWAGSALALPLALAVAVDAASWLALVR